jgi:hypothetical protein
MPHPSVALKARVLSDGINITERALESYGPPFLIKRRAYGNQDPLEYTKRAIPQEILLGERPDLVVAADINPLAGVLLDADSTRHFIVATDDEDRCEVSFPKEPRFYSERMNGGHYVSQIITLYGGGSLGVFAFGRCDLVDRGEACQYCSIEPNRYRDDSYPVAVAPKDLELALRVALKDKSHPARQVMLNGGNFSHPDRGFKYYLRLCEAARAAIDASDREMELHLIVFPPQDLSLLADLAPLDVRVAMNLEVFDEALFQRYCPGKHETAGRGHILHALQVAVEALGPGRVFSILIGGLEGLETLSEGMEWLAERGVTPVINVFHPDPETPLAKHPRPSAQRILEMGSALQSVYREYGFSAFYEGCGRHSLDDEAAAGLFD